MMEFFQVTAFRQCSFTGNGLCDFVIRKCVKVDFSSEFAIIHLHQNIFIQREKEDPEEEVSVLADILYIKIIHVIFCKGH